MQAPAIPLGTTRSTINALQTPKNCEQTARTAVKRTEGFTLAELLVSVGVLVLLVFLATQLLNSAATVSILGNKKMDADSQARQVFDRMAFDFAQMVKRTDVDYYLKSSGSQPGNAQAAFYSRVVGYYPTPTATPVAAPVGTPGVSLVSYRINSNSASPSYNKMERMSKGLAWNAAGSTAPLNSSLTPLVFLPQTISTNWPAAVSTSDITDSNYEVVGPQVFRFEYYYLLKNGQLSSSPWLSSVSGIRGVQDVSAIIVDIAVIDPKSRVLLSDSDIAGLAASLTGYGGQAPGGLLAAWQLALDTNTSLPRPANSGIRVYERYFYLTHDLTH
jgi:hypothetical protein